MSAHSLVVPLMYRRRAFFLACVTQQVRSSGAVPEVLRACAALGGVVAWGVLLAFLVG